MRSTSSITARWASIHGPTEGSIAEQVTVLADLKRKGLIRHIGLSNVTAAQVAEAQAITDIVCVQNNYNLVSRHDDALIDDLARQGIAYVPFFPLGGFTPLQSSTCRPSRNGWGDADASRAGVAAASVAQHPVDSRHVVGRAPAREPGRRAVDAVAGNLGGVGRGRRQGREVNRPAPTNLAQDFMSLRHRYYKPYRFCQEDPDDQASTKRE